MTTEPPENWRDLDVTGDKNLNSKEKETVMTFPNDLDGGTIASDIPTIIKWVQSVEEAEAKSVRLAESGEIIGIRAKIPKSIIKLQGNARKSNQHSQMVSYGPL